MKLNRIDTMNMYSPGKMRKILSSCLAVAVLALMGVGQVQAQPSWATADASATASIDVFEAVSITATDGDLDFGNAQIGEQGVNTVDGATFSVDGSIFDNFGMEVSWTENPTFEGSWTWTPTVEVNGNSQSTGTIAVSPGDEISVTGVTDVPDPAPSGPGNYESTFTMTVSYTNL